MTAMGDLEGALRDMPIFPLPQVVLFPRALLPLHIFEPRYRVMLRDCLASHRVMVMALLLDHASKDAHGQPPIASVAGAGFVVEHQPLPDGRANILLHGAARVRIEELPFVPPYRRARGVILRDIPTHVPDSDRAALFASATAFANEVAKRDPKFSFSLPPSLEPGAIADLCAHHLVIDAHARQAILEQLDVGERVRMVIDELASQHDALREGGNLLN
jgi:ATP-dependent Lon protease